jgi:hypothetical protein
MQRLEKKTSSVRQLLEHNENVYLSKKNNLISDVYLSKNNDFNKWFGQPKMCF